MYPGIDESFPAPPPPYYAPLPRASTVCLAGSSKPSGFPWCMQAVIEYLLRKAKQAGRGEEMEAAIGKVRARLRRSMLVVASGGSRRRPLPIAAGDLARGAPRRSCQETLCLAVP